MFLSKLVPIVFQHHWTGKGGAGEDEQDIDLSSGRSLCMEEAGDGVVQKQQMCVCCRTSPQWRWRRCSPEASRRGNGR